MNRCQPAILIQQPLPFRPFPTRWTWPSNLARVSPASVSSVGSCTRREWMRQVPGQAGRSKAYPSAIQSPCDHDPKPMQPRSKVHATTIQSPCDHDPKSVRPRSKVHTTMIQSPYDHDPKFVRPRPKVRPTTIQSPSDYDPKSVRACPKPHPYWLDIYDLREIRVCPGCLSREQSLGAG